MTTRLKSLWKHDFNPKEYCNAKYIFYSIISFQNNEPKKRACFLVFTHIQKKCVIWKAFCITQRRLLEEERICKNMLVQDASSRRCIHSVITWNKAKWIRWRSNWGQSNQKYRSEPCTRGIPWTTACVSTISSAIVAIIAWSFVPTARIICKNTYCSSRNFQEVVYIRER